MGSRMSSAFLASRRSGSDPDRPLPVSHARSLVFGSRWLWGAVGLTLLGVLLRESAVMLIGLLSLLAVGGGWLWSRAALRNVSVDRMLMTEHAFPGDQIALQVRVMNRKLLPLVWLTIEDHLPGALQIVEQTDMFITRRGGRILRIDTAVRWYEQVIWTLHITCPARGYYVLGPMSIRSGDLFGLYTTIQHIEDVASIIVYPRIISLEHIGIAPRRLFGDLSAQRRIITDPLRIVGSRDYRPEDSSRHIHWTATARTQTLQTKVYEPSTTPQIGIFINLDTHDPYWEGIDAERAEHVITVSAAIAVRALAEHQTAGMYANGIAVGSDQPLRLRPSRSPSQTSAILTGLARLNPIATIDFPTFLQAELARFPANSSVVIVTALITKQTAAVLTDLRQTGHRLVLVTIGDIEIPSIRGLEVFRVDEALLSPFQATST